MLSTRMGLSDPVMRMMAIAIMTMDRQRKMQTPIFCIRRIKDLPRMRMGMLMTEQGGKRSRERD